MLWASIRMVSQLIAVGYLLHLVFAVRSPILVVMMLLAMTGSRYRSQVHVSKKGSTLPGHGKFYFYRCGAVTYLLLSLGCGLFPLYDPRS